MGNSVFRAIVASVVLGGLAGCGAPVAQSPSMPPVARPSEPVRRLPAPAPDRPATPRESARMFVSVLRKMKPAVQRECVQRRTTPANCDFQFVIDDRPNLPVNAFQTVDPQGRPVVGFTLALIAESRNADELAFVMGHEAAHHILGHLGTQGRAATAGAVILGGIAAVAGADPSLVRGVQNIGAQVGARYFSKDWELQADRLGAIIALNAGYNPEHGAEFFLRIPDPGNRILGTHPAHKARISTVHQAVVDAQAGLAR